MVSGIDAKQIEKCVQVMIDQKRNWIFPDGYQHLDVSDKVIKILMGGMKIVQ